MLEETQYSEYVGLQPLELLPWDYMFVSEDGCVTNVPQGICIGNFIPANFKPMNYQIDLLEKLYDTKCVCGSDMIDGACTNKYWMWNVPD